MGCKTAEHQLPSADGILRSDVPNLSPNMDESRAAWTTQLQHYCATFQKKWCFNNSCYKYWYEIGDSKPPSQWIAYQQLCQRWIHKKPILVNIPAQAGFGKSELINAWRLKMKFANETWEAIAPSGVAAVQINGKTLHGLIRMDGTCASFLAPNSVQARELEQTHGLILLMKLG